MFRRVITAVSHWLEYRTQIRRLDAMSDRSLNDIGVSRDRIKIAVLRGVDS